jgi:hypothetical protein
MRLFVSAVLATALFASNALAGDTNTSLAPGKPAGVKDAQMTDNTVVIGLGVALVAAGIAIAASSGNNHNATTVTTTTTAP